MLYVEIETNTDLSTENKTQNMRYKDKFNNLYLIKHAPNLNSIWNKLSVSKNCSKNKRFSNLIKISQ